MRARSELMIELAEQIELFSLDMLVDMAAAVGLKPRITFKRAA